jgi:sarcosine oxidase subunit beta
MALHSLRVFQDFEDRIGGECGFNRTGFVLLVHGKDHDGLVAKIALQRRVGIHTELLSLEALRELMPGVQTSDLVGTRAGLA